MNGEIVKEYLDQFPDSPSLTLSRLIYEENKECFSSVEAVRSLVRYYRGATGVKDANSLKDRKYIREFSKDLFNPFKLPNSDSTEFEPIILPKENNRILILGDIHIPYHDVEACNLAIKYGVDNGANTIILNGDILDMHQLSKFVKDPRKRHYKDELLCLEEFLSAIRVAFKDAKIYFKQGNHEERSETYLKVKAPELYGMPEFELDKIAHFSSYGIEYIKDRRLIKIGKSSLLHGHELPSGFIQPVNVARGVYLRANAHTMVGHWHRTSHHQEKDINGEITSCWSIGCLCELSPEYMPYNRWNHGFLFEVVEDNGDFNVENKMIINGKIH
jgi:predicted phosphodiesterase